MPTFGYFAAKEWELERGRQFDLTHPAVLRRIRKDVEARLVLAAMLAPPCSSFSVAKDRTCVVRSKQFPWGLPPSMLSVADQLRVQNGNKCFHAALKIIEWLDKLRILWILENPASSKCWFLPQLQQLEQSPHTIYMSVITDFCQYGTRWRKRTKLLCGNLDTQDLDRLDKRCTGSGLCSRSGHPHFQLTGSNHQGVPWTRVAQPYPRGLCQQLAFVLISPSRYNCIPPCQ